MSEWLGAFERRPKRGPRRPLGEQAAYGQIGRPHSSHIPAKARRQYSDVDHRVNQVRWRIVLTYLVGLDNTHYRIWAIDINMIRLRRSTISPSSSQANRKRYHFRTNRSPIIPAAHCDDFHAHGVTHTQIHSWKSISGKLLPSQRPSRERMACRASATTVWRLPRCTRSRVISARC
ncbi:MAG: hypothetical protein JWL61_2115 [Gemmatimonadetes bacterium]|nr:hypothetical protein [Gemmatimonadota bacterium]